uniref:hypothetical protein n=1 Tax=Salmonella enterica TaxID=28901 RepID=UPI0020C2BC86
TGRMIMIRNILLAAASLALVATAAVPANAAPCRDSKGKFVKCPEKKPAPAKRCKDARGKFAKCGTPGAKPA